MKNEWQCIKSFLNYFEESRKTVYKAQSYLTAEPLGEYFCFDHWFGNNFSHLDQRFSQR